MYQNIEVLKFREYAWNANDKSDRRTDNSPQGHKMSLKERQISNSRRRASSSRLDPTFDDVAECEIPWEDLVIGERIGLGINFSCIYIYVGLDLHAFVCCNLQAFVTSGLCVFK